MSGQPTPYLGSKISLISKSEIRYEGILYTVDTKESTIALAKEIEETMDYALNVANDVILKQGMFGVQSFGTEDRPTEHPVAARDEVYEYIIFKASDIKDLVVCETPKPVPQLRPGLPYDPAIVTVSQSGGPSISSTLAGQAAAIGRSGPSPPVKAPGLPSGSSSRSETPHQRLASPHDQPQNAWGNSRAPGAGRGYGGPGQGPANRRNFHQGYGQQGSRPQPQGGQNQQYRQPMQQQPRRGDYGGVGFQRGGYRGGFDNRGPPPSRGAWNHPRGGRGSGPNPHQQRPRQQGEGQGQGQKLKFDEDYDFDTANEKFQETLSNLKDEMVKVKLDEDEGSEVGEGKKEEKLRDDSGTETGREGGDSEEQGDEEDNPDFYDKHKSFFDRISCEALERQEGKNNRPNWKVERQQNMETFGQAAVRNYQYRRGGRGYGGRGYGRGGGYNRGGYNRTYTRGGYNNYNSNRY